MIYFLVLISNNRFPLLNVFDFGFSSKQFWLYLYLMFLCIILMFDILCQAMEKIQEVEANYVMQMVRLDNRLAELSKERETLMVIKFLSISIHHERLYIYKYTMSFEFFN